MHELGVVFHIIDSLEDIAAENQVTHISGVVLELGEVSTVIPSYLTDCWNWAVKKHDLLKNAALNIEIIRAVSWCDDCKREFQTVTYGKQCPNCGGGNTWLVTGNEIVIKEIEVTE